MSDLALPRFGLIGALDWLVGFDRGIALASKVLDLVAKLFTVMGSLPTTQARVTVTLAAFAVTTAAYVRASAINSAWVPALEWMAFLVTMSGLDVTQFWSKRSTHTDYVKAKAEAQNRASGTHAVPVTP